MATLPEYLIDKRILRRNLQKGLVTQSDFEAHLGALPDREENVEVVDLSAAEEAVAQAVAEPAAEVTPAAPAPEPAPLAAPAEVEPPSAPEEVPPVSMAQPAPIAEEPASPAYGEPADSTEPTDPPPPSDG